MGFFSHLSDREIDNFLSCVNVVIDFFINNKLREIWNTTTTVFKCCSLSRGAGFLHIRLCITVYASALELYFIGLLGLLLVKKNRAVVLCSVYSGFGGHNPVLLMLERTCREKLFSESLSNSCNAAVKQSDRDPLCIWGISLNTAFSCWNCFQIERTKNFPTSLLC